jgi:hypothetical protein
MGDIEIVLVIQMYIWSFESMHMMTMRTQHFASKTMRKPFDATTKKCAVQQEAPLRRFATEALRGSGLGIRKAP